MDGSKVRGALDPLDHVILPSLLLHNNTHLLGKQSNLLMALLYKQRITTKDLTLLNNNRYRIYM